MAVSTDMLKQYGVFLGKPLSIITSYIGLEGIRGRLQRWSSCLAGYNSPCHPPNSQSSLEQTPKRECITDPNRDVPASLDPAVTSDRYCAPAKE